jgi:hypothetical protein
MLLKSSPLHDMLDFEFLTIGRQMCPNGMMEWWNNGMVRQKSHEDQLSLSRTPLNPLLHHSYTPIFQGRSKAELTVRL